MWGLSAGDDFNITNIKNWASLLYLYNKEWLTVESEDEYGQ